MRYERAGLFDLHADNWRLVLEPEFGSSPRSTAHVDWRATAHPGSKSPPPALPVYETPVIYILAVAEEERVQGFF